jgi:hypothetical protein
MHLAQEIVSRFQRTGAGANQAGFGGTLVVRTRFSEGHPSAQVEIK